MPNHRKKKPVVHTLSSKTRNILKKNNLFNRCVREADEFIDELENVDVEMKEVVEFGSGSDKKRLGDIDHQGRAQTLSSAQSKSRNGINHLEACALRFGKTVSDYEKEIDQPKGATEVFEEETMHTFVNKCQAVYVKVSKFMEMMSDAVSKGAGQLFEPLQQMFSSLLKIIKNAFNTIKEKFGMETGVPEGQPKLRR
jgi:hypothetical protein